MHGGGHVWQGGMHDRGCVTGGHAWQGMCVVGGVHATHAPWQILPLWHMVNKWAVRILLECILVKKYFY